ncbi:hypothetical protein WJX82_007343 [Trebouxia sp. C0006]
MSLASLARWQMPSSHSPYLAPAVKKPRTSTASVLSHDSQRDSVCETPGFGGNAESLQPAIGGAQTKLRLDSMEKFFCSQGLASPIEPPEMQHAGHKRSASEREATDEDFIIHCSQSYTRTASQSIQGSDASQAAECSHGPTASGSTRQAEEVEKRNAPGGSNTTPELANDATGAGVSPSQEKKLFPIFRPKAERKTLYIIRHGESEFNAATNTGKGFSDPQIYDPKLTAKGQSQATKLRNQLMEQKIPEEALWVTSPLTRAIDTLILACPQSHRLGPPPLAEAGLNASTSQQSCPLKLVVRSELSEHMVTTGDVGLPASALRSRYPQLCGAMRGLSEHWWWSPADNNAELEKFHRSEPKQKMKDRVHAFSRWVQSRPEKVIVAFGHSSFWCEFLGGRTRLKNCELHTHFV